MDYNRVMIFVLNMHINGTKFSSWNVSFIIMDVDFTKAWAFIKL